MISAPTDGRLYEMRLRADKTAPAIARDHLQEMTGSILHPELLSDATLALSELVANAWEHGTGDTVLIGVTLMSRMSVELTVENEAAERLPERPWHMPPPDAHRGRGLAVVSTLASDIVVHQGRSAVQLRVLLER